MTAPLVDYLVARTGPPPRSGLAYDYVLGGDGLFLAAENAHLAVRVPVAPCTVRGLPALGAACTLKHGRVPAPIWHALVADARTWAAAGHEAMLAVVFEPPLGYRPLRPPQIMGAARVFYRPTAATVLEVHSHHRMPAFFSRTDDADEQGLRLYAVIGRLDAEHPEVLVRVGAYGYFMPLPWGSVFEGEPGGFRDAQFDEPDGEESDGLPA